MSSWKKPELLLLLLWCVWPIITSAQQSAKGATAATVADRPTVSSLLITEIVTNKSDILSAEEIRNVVSRYLHRQVTQPELTQLISEINQLYVSKGFVTARAVLPEQAVHGGVVTIRLVEGRIGKEMVQNSTHTKESYFLDRVPMSSGEILRIDEVQRKLIYFNAINDVKLRGVLQPGEQFGTTDLLLQAEGPRDVEITFFLIMLDATQSAYIAVA